MISWIKRKLQRKADERLYAIRAINMQPACYVHSRNEEEFEMKEGLKGALLWKGSKTATEVAAALDGSWSWKDAKGDLKAKVDMKFVAVRVNQKA